MINRDFLMGFVSGTVVGAVGYRLYEQNGDNYNALSNLNKVLVANNKQLHLINLLWKSFKRRKNV